MIHNGCGTLKERFGRDASALLLVFCKLKNAIVILRALGEGTSLLTYLEIISITSLGRLESPVDFEGFILRLDFGW